MYLVYSVQTLVSKRHLQLRIHILIKPEILTSEQSWKVFEAFLTCKKVLLTSIHYGCNHHGFASDMLTFTVAMQDKYTQYGLCEHHFEGTIRFCVESSNKFHLMMYRLMNFMINWCKEKNLLKWLSDDFLYFVAYDSFFGGVKRRVREGLL